MAFHGEIDIDPALVDGKSLCLPRVGCVFEKVNGAGLSIQCDMDGAGRHRKGGVSSGGHFNDLWPRNKWGIPDGQTRVYRCIGHAEECLR